MKPDPQGSTVIEDIAWNCRHGSGLALIWMRWIIQCRPGDDLDRGLLTRCKRRNHKIRCLDRLKMSARPRKTLMKKRSPKAEQRRGAAIANVAPRLFVSSSHLV